MTRSQLRFTNLDGSGPPEIASVFQWAVVDRLLGRRQKERQPGQAPRVAPELGQLRHPPRAGQGARLTWIGHASWLIQLDGISLLIDPVFSQRIGPTTQRLVPPALELAALPPIAAQLVTHNHRDHLDLSSLKGVGQPVIAGRGLGAFFARHGLISSELDWWGSARLGPVTVHFVPSQHWSQRGLSDTNETLWGGFVIEGSSARIYHSGDTAYFAGFREIGARCGALDAALLPIGAYDPEWFMNGQHMNPEQAVRAYVDLGARDFVAMHWGTFQLTDEPITEPPQRLAAEWRRRGFEPGRCHVPPIGASLALSSER